jgi:hypothetical protein
MITVKNSCFGWVREPSCLTDLRPFLQRVFAEHNFGEYQDKFTTENVTLTTLFSLIHQYDNFQFSADWVFQVIDRHVKMWNVSVKEGLLGKKDIQNSGTLPPRDGQFQHQTNEKMIPRTNPVRADINIPKPVIRNQEFQGSPALHKPVIVNIQPSPAPKTFQKVNFINSGKTFQVPLGNNQHMVERHPLIDRNQAPPPGALYTAYHPHIGGFGAQQQPWKPYNGQILHPNRISRGDPTVHPSDPQVLKEEHVNIHALAPTSKPTIHGQIQNPIKETRLYNNYFNGIHKNGNREFPRFNLI